MSEVNVQAVVAEAKQAAVAATAQFLQTHGEWGACGFAWVKTYEKGTSKLVRELKKHGFSKAYPSGYDWWNPSKSNSQSVDALSAGAKAAAKVLTEKLGVKFYADDRMD